MTMQKVAWPITIVHSDRPIPQKTKNELSAMPVMMPGSAIGKTTANETVSLPKNLKRCTAKAAADPSSSAIDVAATLALSDRTKAVLISSLANADPNQRNDRPAIGHVWMFDALKA